MNIIRKYSKEGKTLQELMEKLFKIYLSEKINNME